MRIRATRLALKLALTTAALLALAATPASAAVTHPFLSSFDGSATPAGAFLPAGLAVDNSGGASAGDLYVSDQNNQVVDKYSGAPSPGYLCQITAAGSATTSPSECDTSAAGTPTGSFASLQGDPAVDPATGDVWVPDFSGNVVDEFSPAGVYLGQVTVPNGGTPWAVAIDASGNLYVVDRANAVVDEYSPSTLSWSTFATGTPSGGFGFQLNGVAVDLDPSSPSFGDVYVADSFPNQVVDVFDSSGTFLRQLTSTPGGSFGFALNVAVDPTSGEVYVTEGNQSDFLDEFSATGSFEGQIVVPGGASAAYPAAVAIDATNGDVYVADQANSLVDVFGPNEIIPDVTTGSASNVAPTSATLNGTVNPDGVEVTDCHFAYVDDAHFNASAPDPYSSGQTAPCAETVGSGTSDLPVHADLSGLTAGVTYHFRLLASNASGSNQGQDATFSTPPPPSIDFAAAQNLTPTDADLVANINPEGSDTTYHFEWGTANCSSNPCTSVPIPDGDIGSGGSDVTVSTHLTGLTANTTYHWRILATNASGTSGAAADHTFIYDTSGGGLPDNRAYEQVTPPEKNAALIGDVFLSLFAGDISDNGSRLNLSSVQCFADPGSCTVARGPIGTPFSFTRTASGWVTTPLAPPATQFDQNTAYATSATADTALFSMPTPPAGQDDFYARQPDGSFLDIGPAFSPSLAGDPSVLSALVSDVKAATADLSHLVYAGNGPFWPFDATQANDATLYEYAGTGNTAPALVGVTGGVGSTDLISTCGTLLGSSGNGIVPAELSADGRIVYFTAVVCSSGSGANAGTPVPAEALYARIDSSSTVAISEPTAADCSACDTSSPADATFVGASADGSKAFFLTTQPLLGVDTTQNLYQFDSAAPAGQRVTRLSAGDPSAANVEGVAAISPDGSHVYFVAKGVLTATANAQGQTAQNGANNLYVHDAASGDTAFVAALPDSDSDEWVNGVGQPANVTPDGRFLVFTSRGALTPDTGSSGVKQVFRYDASSGDLVRISIGNDGLNDNGNSPTSTVCTSLSCPDGGTIAPAQNFFFSRTGEARTDPTMSHDGARVFFMSPLALTPHALNDVRIGTDDRGNPAYAQNVYQWQAGHVSLISDGRDTSAVASVPCQNDLSSVCLLGADATGANVFFSTADQLVPQDTDTQVDFYDARIGGGFPFTPPPQPCSGDNCKPPPAGSPPGQTFGSSGFSGPGNPTPSRQRPATKRKCKKHHKRKCKKSRKSSARAAGTTRRAGR